MASASIDNVNDQSATSTEENAVAKLKLETPTFEPLMYTSHNTNNYLKINKSAHLMPEASIIHHIYLYTTYTYSAFDTNG